MNLNLPKAATIMDLTTNVLEIHNRLCDGTIKPKDVVEIHNGVGKISSLLKIQLEYYKMRGEKPGPGLLKLLPTKTDIEASSKHIEKAS
jgi:hypothetical protein